MKKLAVTLCLSAIAVGAFAQGTVNFLNGTTTLTRTNGTGIGLGAGNTTPGAGFYYAIFTAPRRSRRRQPRISSVPRGPSLASMERTLPLQPAVVSAVAVTSRLFRVGAQA